VTFAFSEATTDFTLADTTATGGVLSNLATSDGGLTYTATFMANAGTDISNASVSVTNASYTENNGNAGTGGSTGSFVVDTVIPTVTVSIDNHDVNVAQGTGTVTFAFSEATTDFTLADTTATGGVLSNLATSDGGLTYTATFMANAGTDISNASVSVTNASYTENNGNAGTGGSTGSFVVDTVIPTVTVSIDNHDVNVAQGTGTVTFAFSEATTDFTLADTTATGGVLSNLATGDGGLTYTATFIANAGTDISNASVSVTNASYTENNGNAGTGGSTGSFVVDTVTPTVSSVVDTGAAIDGSGNGDLNAGRVVTLTANMSEAVTVAGGTPTLSLNNGGTASYTGGSGTGALSFSYTVGAGQDTGDLTVTSFNLNGATLQDAAGNSANLSGAVTNPAGTLQIATLAPTVPTIISIGPGGQRR